ncbi:UDP-N-acetylmuramoyl-tripeptide--D-alanyl-D-alanine ligase [Paludibacterium yongneupense]|uniref:UDP-N-acetylmuramoyl-tripeptide--D-alanyl-D- alanine ligase n=1 Tax=Paludibacterium yongneupense TaxID=400061 RepID=UPI0004008E4B
MFSLIEAARLAGGQAHGPDLALRRVVTDSRVAAAGDLFVALKGERFDAHDFVADVVARGAAVMVSTVSPACEGASVICVEDTRLALGRLAAGWRARFSLPLIGVTGSNGKTSVKEMLAAILRAAVGDEAVLATQGNFNNDIGLPLTLLRLNSRHRFAVIEMGMNHPGEIRYLGGIARPDAVVVNNALRAHLGGFDGVEGIARAKAEIFEDLSASGVAVLNRDDDNYALFCDLAAGKRQLAFGLDSGDVHARDITLSPRESTFDVVTPAGGVAVRLPAPGVHNVRNALAASALAHAVGIDAATIARGLAAIKGVKGRLQYSHAANGAVLIDDSYNANPDSMKAGLDVLASAAAPRWFVMGDIGELGETAPALHAEVGAHARICGVERLLALGELSRHAVSAFGAGAEHFATIEELTAYLDGHLPATATVLVKGSRFMRMERVIEHLGTRHKEGV